MQYTNKMRHNIRMRQMMELLVAFYILWYVIEFLIRLCIVRNVRRARQEMLFEQEVELFSDETNYLRWRKPYTWIGFI